MVEIIPAILPYSLKELTATLERLRGVSTKIQIDVYEGGWFGWGRTWPFADKRSFHRMLKEKKALPYWTEFDIEFDLMVGNPTELAYTVTRLHASRIVLHARFPGALAAARALDDYTDDEHATPVGIGVAVGVNDPLDSLEPFEHFMDFVQVMGIARVGAQGRPFDERALALVSRLRRRYPNLPIQVDGGVAGRVRALARAGANRLVVGSAIVRAKNPGEVYKQLYTEANG